MLSTFNYYKGKIVRVLFLIKSAKTPSSRLRVTDLEHILVENGIEPVIEILSTKGSERRKQLKKAVDFPVVMLQKRLLKWFDFRLLRKSAKLLVFDYDDAIYLKNASPSQNPDDYKSSTRDRLFRRVVNGVDMVIASTPVLSGVVKEFAPETPVEIVPSSVKMDELTPRENNNLNGKPVIGWTGQGTTLRYLDYIKPALLKLREEHDFIMRVMSNIPPSDEFKDGLNVEFVKWEEKTEYSMIRCFDIGIMPLSEDPFSRGKAAYKLLQYMCLGVPSVCSPVGMNKDVAGDDENCLTASTPEEFAPQLKRLIEDDDLRKRLAENGKNLVAAKYSRQVVGAQLANVLKDFYAKHSAS